MKLILASGSPRRAEILRAAGFSFDIIPADIDEILSPGEPATDYVQRLAEEKAHTVARKIAAIEPATQAIVIAADTTVVVNGAILEKPQSASDARRMLEQLSGGMHDIYTGVVLLRLPDGAARKFVDVTRVYFADLSAAEIADYIASGEPFGKAGAYAIQGLGGRFVKRIEGSYFNVMGLPLGRIYQELRKFQEETASAPTHHN
ncbi:MAG TPA: Maf family protein [Candidatus Acidoferrales bacterium]